MHFLLTSDLFWCSNIFVSNNASFDSIQYNSTKFNFYSNKTINMQRFQIYTKTEVGISRKRSYSRWIKNFSPCVLVSKKELEDQASSTEMKIDEFLQDTKCALSLAHDPTKKKFSQSIESEKNYLKVKKI